MELQSDRQEISLRLLQNGKYVWTITVNTQAPIDFNSETYIANKFKNMDNALRDAFPNHVEKSSVKFQELE